MSDFERYAPAIAFFHVGAGLVAATFGLEVLRDGSPVTPELYGARVHAVPALLWVTIQLTTSVLAAGGAAFGGRLGALACLIGSAGVGGLFAMFAALAMDAPQGTLLAAGCTFVMAPSSALSALFAARHLWGRERVGR